MKSIKKVFIALSFFCLYSVAIKAQGFATYDMGRPMNTKTYTEVNGSPYSSDHWIEGVVAMKDGSIYKNIPLKYDQVADELLFKPSNGDTSALAFVKPVHEFILPIVSNEKTVDKIVEKNYRNGFPAVANNTTDSFYEVLYDGKTKILKRTRKFIQSHKDYSSANQINDIFSNTSYYVLKDAKMTPVKPGNKAIIEALNDKSVDVEKYIKDNKLDAKKDADLIKIFTYYNSL